jgi:tetratricopeptide (TPR) repeat protein
MYGVLGLIVGLVIGFMFANNVNRSAVGKVAPSGPAAQMPDISSDDQTLPPNHPPIGTTGGGQTAGQPGGAAQIAQVTAAIEKAKANPQDFEAQMTAADLYYEIQRFDDAVKYYEAAAKLKPDDKEAMVKTGNAYFDGEKYEQAEKWYTEALKKDSKDIDVRTDLGLSFFLREPRDIDRAIKEYQASLAINPTHEVTLQNLAIAYSEKGDSTDLAQTIERLKKVNPNNPVITKTQAK